MFFSNFHLKKKEMKKKNYHTKRSKPPSLIFIARLGKGKAWLLTMVDGDCFFFFFSNPKKKVLQRQFSVHGNCGFRSSSSGGGIERQWRRRGGIGESANDSSSLTFFFFFFFFFFLKGCAEKFGGAVFLPVCFLGFRIEMNFMFRYGFG
ncbi:hypothetical protein ACP275_13G045700 [Erythranthe tilingii]